MTTGIKCSDLDICFFVFLDGGWRRHMGMLVYYALRQITRNRLLFPFLRQTLVSGDSVESCWQEVKNEWRGEADVTLWWDTLWGLGLSAWEAKCHGWREQVFLLNSAWNSTLSWQCAYCGSGVIGGLLPWHKYQGECKGCPQCKHPWFSFRQCQGQWTMAGAAEAEEDKFSRSWVGTGLRTPERCRISVTPFQGHHSH